ncbi:DUF2206 domain-containing protein [Methanosphaera sp. WGK6]|uniref:DUF2206 domain-containing protein n=1 Tax=Methanosphaera sp. WGK6 TaxID=1561964 RepID=UPI00084C7757|nr:DUF2206 domain-containing protein [Methanosphaera sp. WGK6]OED30837.1 hypothetical protein NL43_00550 [Methanosphaera sp. WGK6]
MEFRNIFTLNDWKFKEFTYTIILIQVLMWIVGIISANNIHIPIFNDIITLLYLGFVPGIIILRILKLHDLGNTFTTLLSVGLSILSVLLVGLFMNQVYPWIGLTQPIENIPLLITFTIYNTILWIVSYYQDRDAYYVNSSKLSFELLFSNQFICICILPLIAIIGAYTLQYYENNTIQIILLILICVLVLAMAWGYLKKEYYHLALFSIAISILYYSVLISNHIWGYDIFFEYQFATYVIKNGIWDYTWPHAYNAMLSVVMYAPIYSKLSGMTLTWVLKFIYPFLFSLISIGLYKIFEEHTGSKIAFMATFFFIAYNGFSYGWMVQMARQQIAEIFLVLLVWLIIDRKIPQNKRKLLFLLFGVGLILSHYSVTYLFMFMLLATIVTLTLVSSNFGNIINTILIKLGAERRYFGKYFKVKNQTISLPLSLFFIGFIIVYYSLTADSKPIASLFDALKIVSKNTNTILFGGIINPMVLLTGLGILIILLVIGYKIYKKISADIDPESITSYSKIKNNIIKFKQMSLRRKQGIIVLVTVLTIIHIWWPFKYMNIVSINAQRVIYLSVYFIIIGFIMNIIRPKYFHFTREYNTFAIFNMVILACGIFIPAFRGQLSLQRIYEVTFVILAPFCVIGLYYISTSVLGVIKSFNIKQRTKTAMKVIGIFMVVFFILNTGLIDLAVGQTSTLPLDTSMDAPLFSQGEYAGVAWFNNYHNNEDNDTVFSDAFSNILLYWLNDIRTTNPKNMSDMEVGSYLFLRSHNINHKTFLYGNGEYISIIEGIDKSSKIYDNGDSQIYKRTFK